MGTGEEENTSNHLIDSTTTESNQASVENHSVNDDKLREQVLEPNVHEVKGDEPSVMDTKVGEQVLDPKPNLTVAVEETTVEETTVEETTVEKEIIVKNRNLESVVDGGEDAIEEETAIADVTDAEYGGSELISGKIDCGECDEDVEEDVRKNEEDNDTVGLSVTENDEHRGEGEREDAKMEEDASLMPVAEIGEKEEVRTGVKCDDVIEGETETVKMEEDAPSSLQAAETGEQEEARIDVKSDVVVETVEEDEAVTASQDDVQGVNAVEKDEAVTAGQDDVQGVNAEQIVEDEEGKTADEYKPVGVTENDEEEPMEASEHKPLDTDLETDEEKAGAESPEQPIKTRGGRGRKRKRGGKTSQATPKSTGGGGKTVEDEDVCFICYDGGDLVLCDKRNCPKAYHPSCINRDEAFFQTKGQWNCGWHLCTHCSKKAEYLCYTCTSSLCKSCFKTNVMLCVKEKEKKGFCESCVETLMLIENGSPEDQGSIDVNDKNSWEYLFRDYWTDIKAKLNISLSELIEAKNAWEASNLAGKQELPARHSDGDSGSENPSKNLESQTRKTRSRKSKKPKTRGSAASASDGDSGPESPSENLESQTRKTRRRKTKQPKTHGSGASAPDGTQWASKELLEFVKHMGKDTSFQSQFDVQALLLEYIKTNNLRDSRRKSQIICDARLQRLFSKPRVGHFEMLKLLESHFLIKEDDDVQGSVVDTDFSPIDDEKTKDKKRKHRKKGDQEPQSNRDDYAAIDIHNINLIYLRRKLAEDLLDDTESFHSKVVDTFVRIRISGANHNQDLYRLVQVTGTTTTGAHYAVGKKSTDIMLEILNLDKTESVSIDTISNQEFTEDECNRLRQSIKCGLINSLTVGDILDKAIELQAARVNDWIESEVVRLSHLRDRASDLGQCVEKLEVLKTPEERARRLHDIPVIHDDPTMDPKYESEDDTNEDDKKQDMYNSFVDSRFSKRRDYPSKESWRGTGASTSRSPGKSYEFSRNLSSNNYSKKVEEAATSPRMGLHNDNIRDQGRERIVQPSPSVVKKPSSANETVKIVGSTKEDVSETEKLWHYKDPTGKIQGPFTMAQLRKWNNNKFFPVDLRIWRTSEKEKDGILLTDALEGRFTVKMDRPGLANLPSPTPNQTLGHPGPHLGPSSYHEGLQSPTPNGSQLSASLVAGGNREPNVMVQSLAPGQNAYGWSGGPPQNQQPNQWVVQNPAGNFLQQPPGPPQPNVSWPAVAPVPNMGIVGPATGNQPMNLGAVNVNSPWVQAGPGMVNPGWVPPQPVLGVTPTQGWVPGPAPTPVPIVPGNWNPGEVAAVGNSNQGWGSPRPRNGGDPYNRSRGGGSGFNGNRSQWEKHGSFNNRGR
ncbi:hypothetical protein QVD17_03685 [Tagetes erecta]|uniref:Uncharacterized protein n=1 Tax=Tagetes erecta TaxID=13708 RepID=A0AAD8L8S3_TARER|nr:hypothetical protein QVD17_03685 [Tagetes erecta]